jgi:hypothetical protein
VRGLSTYSNTGPNTHENPAFEGDARQKQAGAERSLQCHGDSGGTGGRVFRTLPSLCPRYHHLCFRHIPGTFFGMRDSAFPSTLLISRSVQRKNMAGLYDVLGTLAETVGPSMISAEVAGRLFPLLTTQWAAAHELQEKTGVRPDLFPLLECLASVSTAVKGHVQSYAEPIFRNASILARSAVQRSLVRSRRLFFIFLSLLSAPRFFQYTPNALLFCADDGDRRRRGL